MDAPDPAAHQDLGAALAPVLLQRLAVFHRVLHARDVLHALAVRVEELLVDARPADRLDELEAQPVDHGLGADHAELAGFAPHHGVVQQRRLVVEHAPRPPAEVLRVGTQRGFHVRDHHGDLRDRHGHHWRHDTRAVTACHPIPPRVFATAGPRSTWARSCEGHHRQGLLVSVSSPAEKSIRSSLAHLLARPSICPPAGRCKS